MIEKEYEEMLLENLRKNEEINYLMRQCFPFSVGADSAPEIETLVKKTWLEATRQADIRDSIKWEITF